jgi:hypothetical protein
MVTTVTFRYLPEEAAGSVGLSPWISLAGTPQLLKPYLIKWASIWLDKNIIFFRKISEPLSLNC